MVPTAVTEHVLYCSVTYLLNPLGDAHEQAEAGDACSPR
jgi:hypothetical protein